MALSLPTRDRRVLARSILPYFAGRSDFRRVLFVGCAWYTRGYQALFRDAHYVTLDVDPAKRRWGAAHHVCDSLARLDAHFAAASLDLVVCNGVFGWGLDAPAEVEAAFAACHVCLRPGGILVLGWNDIPRRCPFALEECASLQRFRPFCFPPLGAPRYRTGSRNCHTYDFYAR